MNTEVMFSSASSAWNTPQEVLDRVYRVGRIWLDPCGAEDDLVVAEKKILLPNNGLNVPWGKSVSLKRQKLVYCNPPYSRDIGDWTRKATIGSPEVIMLLPARTDTVWWHRDVTLADSICFWKGRLRFSGAKSGAPFPSAVVYFGTRVERFTQAFQDAGWMVHPR